MLNHQYSEGDLIIGKLGTNPWWPGVIIECNKIVDNNHQFFVKFFEINIESWIEMNNILNCSSREEMEHYLNTIQKTNSNVKYLNYIPSAMVKLYNEAWKKFDTKQNLRNYKDSHNHITNDVVINKVQSIGEHLSEKVSESYPCEICLMKEIEFDCGSKNQSFMKMSENEQSIYFSRLMLIDDGDYNTKCSNYCCWKYHKNCVKDENDLVCSCNKSVWLCSICDEVITVTQLFVCNNHKCMRSYHRSCLIFHFEMNPDMKQCPLHNCINCSLDYMVEKENEHSLSQVDLVNCVKCKLAFHNSSDCLPTMYINITNNLIICYRHLIESDTLQSNVAGFCFYCSRPISDNPVSCKFCMVTYHKSVPCLSGATELIDDDTFVCNACKFPYVHRAQYYVLAVPREISIPDNIHSWKFGLLNQTNINQMVVKTVAVTDEAGRKWFTDIHKTISINLQSLDHLVCFGMLRFKDIQFALRHHAKLVERVCDTYNLCQNLYRNAFVLRLAGLFPLAENVYYDEAESFMPKSDCVVVIKCTCLDACTTKKCPNVMSNTECTEDNCAALSKCRNRRLQKRHYPRYKLFITEKSGYEKSVMMEETVVKDVLVSELVGVVKSTAWADVNFERNGKSDSIIKLSAETVLDCTQFCSMARFIKKSDRPNLQPKVIMVAGLPRIGMFSTHRIVKGDILTVDPKSLVYRGSFNFDVAPKSLNLETWKENTDVVNPITDELFVIDLCNEENDQSYAEMRNNNTETISALPPLCPACLQELVVDQAKLRVLIHCRICYSVFHFKCACMSLKLNDLFCNRLEQEARILNFICQICNKIPIQE